MRSKLTWIDYTIDLGACDRTMAVLTFLESLGVRSAAETADSLSIEMDGEYCNECREHHDNCECKQEFRYMREYDDGADYET